MQDTFCLNIPHQFLYEARSQISLCLTPWEIWLRDYLSPFSSLTLPIILMNTFCFVTMRAALFLSQTISALKCCLRWELISFHSRLLLFIEESGLDGQDHVVLRVIVSDPSHILHLPPPSKYYTSPTKITFVWLKDFVCRLKTQR